MSGTKLVTEVRTITPKQAKEILETSNEGNRNVRKARVERWAREMKAGNWKLTGEPIIFAKSGRLLNGQHRLHAVVEANIPLTTVVIVGVDEGAFNVMDSGMARSMGDVFRSHGIKSGNQQASNTKFVMQYLDGVSLVNHKYMDKYTRDDLVAYFEANRTAFEFADSRGCTLRNIGLPRGVAGVVSYILYSADYDGADYFISRLQDGAGLRPTSPILALRNYIIRTFSASHRPTDVADWLIPTIIRGYNDWATGARRQRVSVWKSGDALPMPVSADKRVSPTK